MILDQHGRPYAEKRRQLRARYDAAQTTNENTRHWINADGLSADAANSPAVRRILRNRARYEITHNGPLRGMVRKRANEVIGYGPMLQIIGEESERARFVRKEFTRWSEAVGLVQKFHLARRVRSIDGESFTLLTSSPNLPTPVKLQLRLFEAERCTTPGLLITQRNRCDGIDFDQFGDPERYHVLKEHPESAFYSPTADAEQIAARFVLHWFWAERPEQHRGICEFLTALPLGAQLRRYTLAVIGAAEIAALQTTTLESDAEADDEEVPTPFETLDLDRNMMTVVPAGWKMRQMTAEQPTTIYPDFKDEIVAEMGSADGMPAGLARGHSKGMNFAGGRLDQILWTLDVEIDQEFTVAAMLDPILAAWLDEARTITNVEGYPIQFDGGMPRHQWIFRGRERGTDETKAENARDTRLRNGMSSYPVEYAGIGLDWEEVQEQQAVALGVTLDEYRKLLRDELFGNAQKVAAAKAQEAAQEDDE